MIELIPLLNVFLLLAAAAISWWSGFLHSENPLLSYVLALVGAGFPGIGIWLLAREQAAAVKLESTVQTIVRELTPSERLFLSGLTGHFFELESGSKIKAMREVFAHIKTVHPDERFDLFGLDSLVGKKLIRYDKESGRWAFTPTGKRVLSHLVEARVQPFQLS